MSHRMLPDAPKDVWNRELSNYRQMRNRDTLPAVRDPMDGKVNDGMITIKDSTFSDLKKSIIVLKRVT